MTHGLNQSRRDCLDAVNACATECGVCFSMMVGKDSKSSCPACCIECAAVCRLLVDAIARDSPFVNQIRQLCADVCNWCAQECDAQRMESCKRCAEECRRCAEVCLQMAACA